MNNKNVVLLYLGDCFYDARCINMIKSLIAEGALVSVICTYRKLINYEEFDGVFFYSVPLVPSGFYKYWVYYKSASKILKNIPCDVVISGDLYSLSVAYTKAKTANIFYDCREIYSQLAAHHNKPWYRILCSIYESFYLSKVHTVFITAETDLIFLQNKYSRFKHLHWVIIYNYPTKTIIRHSVNLHKKYNIPASQLLVVYQGVLQKNRGIKELLCLTHDDVRITAVIIGSGEESSRYRLLVNKLSIKDRVIFLSHVPYLSLLEYTAACNVGWAVIQKKTVSNQFALPNKLFEYMAAELPVVASNLPNIKKIIDKYPCAVLVNPKNKIEHKNAINKIIKNKPIYINTYRQTADLFTWETQHNLFIEALYEQ